MVTHKCRQNLEKDTIAMVPTDPAKSFFEFAAMVAKRFSDFHSPFLREVWLIGE